MDSLLHPKEKFYFGISVVSSLLIYLLLVVSILGIVYLVMGVIIFLITHGLFIGYLRGNGIRVSEKQFPEVYRLDSTLPILWNLIQSLRFTSCKQEVC